MVFGASESDWWQLASGHDMVQVAPRKGLGQSARNGIEVIAQYELEKLETLRFLGIPELADTTGAQWPDEARFVAESPHRGSIEGRILEWAGDFPEAVEYRVGDPSKPWIRVTYGYCPSAGLPPREIIRTVWQGSELLTLTNVIDAWEPGIDLAHRDGYVISDFRLRRERIDYFYMWSNGVRHVLTADGQIVVSPGEVPNYEELAPQGLPAGLVLTIWIAVAAGMGIWVGAHWLSRRAGSPQRSEESRPRREKRQ